MNKSITDGTALLIMDVQAGIIDRANNKDDYLVGVRKIIDFAHQINLPVLFVVVGFRVGVPEISISNKMFGAIKTATPATFIEPQPLISPLDHDVVILKRRVSAFSGSDLEVILRAQNISHLILTGISTSGVVLSTLREAADKDYQITVISDLCADADEEVNTVLLEKVFPRQATVTTSDQWMSELPSV